jgi:hypothetical protein
MMPKTRFEISRLLSGDYGLRMFPADASEHDLLPVVGRTLGSFASEDEARRVVPAHLAAQEPYEVVLVR